MRCTYGNRNYWDKGKTVNGKGHRLQTETTFTCLRLWHVVDLHDLFSHGLNHWILTILSFISKKERKDSGS